MLHKWLRDAPVRSALVGAAIIGAQYIAGKAARDAIFLAYFDTSSLPAMVMGTSIFSIVLVVATAKAFRNVAPSAYVPAAFAVAALLFLIEWGLTFVAPRLTAPLLYLQVSGIGPLLGSGFWLIASEQFDPRTAKKRFGQIGAAGTIGGLAGGLLAARLASVADVASLLPLLAAFNIVCAWQARELARTAPRLPAPVQSSLAQRSGMRVLRETPYLRNLAFLVLFGTIAAALIDYVFKVQVKAAFAGGSGLGSFFSLYYALVSLVTFAVQAFTASAVLQKLGLTAAMGAPALSVIAGGAALLAFPGLRSVVSTRAGESVSRSSLLRSGYELFYTPIPADDKRAVKGLIDVGVDRTGDIIGAGIIQFLLWALPVNLTFILVLLAIGCALVQLMFATRLSRGYVKALETSLLNRAVELDLHDVEDRQTRTIVLRTLGLTSPILTTSLTTHESGTDEEVQQILDLKSQDVARVRRGLRRTNNPPPAVVPHIISLLASEPVLHDALNALRSVAEARVGMLTDALVDPTQPFVVRRRVALVFGACTSQRAADGAMLGLKDTRFEVRFRCARSLAAITSRNPQVRIDGARVLDVVRAEIAVSPKVWYGRHGVNRSEDDQGDDAPSGSGEAGRSSRALEHVFALLGLVLPAEPLQAAYRGLQSTNKSLRGTALEYLESVLPPDIRTQLWPFLDENAGPSATTRPSEQVLADLLRSNQSPKTK